MLFQNIVAQTQVKPGSVAIFWIGQAGFLLKTAQDEIILIDPYLTDSVYDLYHRENGYSFKRLAPALFEPDEIVADYIFCSHEHEDHLDRAAIAALVNNPRTMLCVAPASARIAAAAGVPDNKMVQISRGMTKSFAEFELVIVAAQHGQLSPEAMGFILDFGFIRIYYAGDTAYDLAVLAPALAAKPEIALLPINGAYGNLNSIEAAQLANDLQAKICIPHHFWTFPMHLGNPQEFINVMPWYAPACQLLMLTPGEPFICGR